ncbi:asparagine--tRNA ligase, cytoplasmic-like [Artemia franciscana]|uniref:Asparagine--tRNA ligase, cytoplasmic n=1 Tax=Artemia franciscana TaxID=6661 RepID=A0AA88HL31_ARTSF|nr:hypothetical protein QYM36_015396 [Artemia franciscana]
MAMIKIAMIGASVTFAGISVWWFLGKPRIFQASDYGQQANTSEQFDEKRDVDSKADGFEYTPKPKSALKRAQAKTTAAAAVKNQDEEKEKQERRAIISRQANTLEKFYEKGDVDSKADGLEYTPKPKSALKRAQAKTTAAAVKNQDEEKEKQERRAIISGQANTSEKFYEKGDVDSKADGFEYTPKPKSALKRAQKLEKLKEAKKTAQAKNQDKEKEKQERRAKKIEEARRIKISEDKTLPTAKVIKIKDSTEHRERRVKIQGWVHHLRREGKKLLFIQLRDGTGYLQCVLTNLLSSTYEAITLTTESSVTLFGKVMELPPGSHHKAPGDHELIVDYWELICGAPSGGTYYILDKKSNVDFQLDNRHIVIRGTNTSKNLKAASLVTQLIREHHLDRGYMEVHPPCIVQTKTESSLFDSNKIGSSLFELQYYGKKAYLTQSSQLYLESVIAALGDVFCIQKSFRAGKFRTSYHLSEFTHIEAEFPFITFKNLLEKIEDLVVSVCDRITNPNNPLGQLVFEINPDFRTPRRPFKRMSYTEVIQYLKDNNIKKINGTFYTLEDDIPESAERTMINKINEPILVCRFPKGVKPFYTKKCSDDPQLTESVDLLMPGVGEILGASMRIDNYDELIKAFIEKEIEPSTYYWYSDQRKFGSCAHGGYGLGLERFLMWILNLDQICDACLYPRILDRYKP